VKRALLLATVLAVAKPAGAWEAETTQAGLAEQAALASRLHKRLVSLGFTGGLFEPLTIPPADAPALMQALKLLSPSHGSVPDARGRQSAIAWLAAGAVLADVPASHGANHFFDPATGRGWERPDRSVFGAIADRAREAVGRSELPAKGVPAPDWIVDKKNPFNLDGFFAQYGKAVTAATPGERSRHMAAALVAAGAIMHVLGDLGAPSRVRGDEAAHLEPLGGGPDDLGSRFERIAALAYGRLGVPGPSRVITRTHLREYFTGKDGGGLADVIARSYFSPNTLPHPFAIEDKPRLARPQPALPTRLNLMAATRDEGSTLRNATGTCLARYKVDRGIVSFALDDDCVLEELAQILPDVAAYETGLLDFLLRGELTINVGTTVTITGKDLGAGSVDVVVEDERGVRTPLAALKPNAGELARVSAPQSGTRVLAVFRGVDAAGEPIVAVGALPLGH
jgi:hypothetical protein